MSNTNITIKEASCAPSSYVNDTWKITVDGTNGGVDTMDLYFQYQWTNPEASSTSSAFSLTAKVLALLGFMAALLL